jgi:hypothetical protein
MLDRLFYNFSLPIHHLHVVHQVRHIAVHALSRLEQSNPPEVSHLVDKGHIRRVGIDYNFCLMGLLVY